VWYYEQPLPEGRKNYTKTAPIQFEEFTDCLKWLPEQKENDHAWKWDFKKDFDKAVAEAEPHWKKAESERNRASTLNRQAKDIARRLEELRVSKSKRSTEELELKRLQLLEDVRAAES